MPIIFYVWAGSLLAATLLASPAEPQFRGRSTLTAVLSLLFVATTLIGLWQAWSPWELTSK